jgi:hypothetical protein
MEDPKQYLSEIFADKRHGFFRRAFGWFRNNKLLTFIIFALIGTITTAVYCVFSSRFPQNKVEVSIISLSILATVLITILAFSLQKMQEDAKDQKRIQSLLIAFYTEINEAFIRYKKIKDSLPSELFLLKPLFVKSDPFIVYQENAGRIDEIKCHRLVQLIIKIYHLGYDVIEVFKFFNHAIDRLERANQKYDEYLFAPAHVNISSYPQEMTEELRELVEKRARIFEQKCSNFKAEIKLEGQVYKKSLDSLDKIHEELAATIEELNSCFVTENIGAFKSGAKRN